MAGAVEWSHKKVWLKLLLWLTLAFLRDESRTSPPLIFRCDQIYPRGAWPWLWPASDSPLGVLSYKDRLQPSPRGLQELTQV